MATLRDFGWWRTGLQSPAHVRNYVGVHVPKFQRMVTAVTAQIASGELKRGDRLPSGAELCRQFGVSAGTVRAAMLKLKALGLVEGQQGDGVFVSARAGGRVYEPNGGPPPAPTPLYQDIIDDIRDQIARGVLKPGDRLPGYTALRRQYRASYGRVRDALLVLKSEQVLVAAARPGRRDGLRVSREPLAGAAAPGGVQAGCPPGTPM